MEVSAGNARRQTRRDALDRNSPVPLAIILSGSLWSSQATGTTYTGCPRKAALWLPAALARYDCQSWRKLESVTVARRRLEPDRAARELSLRYFALRPSPARH